MLGYTWTGLFLDKSYFLCWDDFHIILPKKHPTKFRTRNKGQPMCQKHTSITRKGKKKTCLENLLKNP